tara:strand:- start:791 stop:1093 length:303 start_codon:yes stop_codon:yes gene_type:complete
MSEQIRKYGVYSVLGIILAPFAVYAIVWIYNQAIRVPHIVISMERIEKTNKDGHSKVVKLIEEQTSIMMLNERRLYTLEVDCAHIKDEIDKCRVDHKWGL